MRRRTRVHPIRRWFAVFMGLWFTYEVVQRVWLVDPTSPDFVFDAFHVDRQISDWLIRRHGGVEGERHWISINPQGWRDAQPFDHPKMPGTLRVAVVGTGNVFGENLADDQTWPAVLERELASQRVTPVEVFNYGRPGATIVFLDRWLLDKVLARNPDVVVVAFAGFNEALLSDALETQVVAPDQYVLNTLRGTIAWRQLEAMYWRQMTGTERKAKVPLETYGHLLRDTVKRIEAAGAQPVLVAEHVVHPDIEGLWRLDDLDAYRAEMSSIAREKQIPFADPAILLSGKSADAWFWNQLLYNQPAADQIGRAVASLL